MRLSSYHRISWTGNIALLFISGACIHQQQVVPAPVVQEPARNFELEIWVSDLKPATADFTGMVQPINISLVPPFFRTCQEAPYLYRLAYQLPHPSLVNQIVDLWARSGVLIKVRQQ